MTEQESFEELMKALRDWQQSIDETLEEIRKLKELTIPKEAD